MSVIVWVFCVAVNKVDWVNILYSDSIGWVVVSFRHRPCQDNNVIDAPSVCGVVKVDHSSVMLVATCAATSASVLMFCPKRSLPPQESLGSDWVHVENHANSFLAAARWHPCSQPEHFNESLLLVLLRRRKRVNRLKIRIGVPRQDLICNNLRTSEHGHWSKVKVEQLPSPLLGDREFRSCLYIDVS